MGYKYLEGYGIFIDQKINISKTSVIHKLSNLFKENLFINLIKPIYQLNKFNFPSEFCFVRYL